jgi:dihydrofolate reductase
MRRITYGGAVSLDGFLTGPDGALDWLHFSADVQAVMADYWKSVDTILMGRKTYAVAAQSAPRKKPKRASTNRSRSSSPSMRTFVFSRSLQSADAPDVELVRDNAAEFVWQLKQQPGKEICLMGGGELAQTLLGAGLVDKVGFNIHPVLLGAGVPAFRDPGHRVALQLTECKVIDGGCIIASYDVRDVRRIET